MSEERKTEGDEEPTLRETGAAYQSGSAEEMVTVSFEVPRWAFATLRMSPRAYVRGMHEAAVTLWYERRLVSQSRAAELLGVSRAEFLDILSKYEVTPFQYESPAELAEEAARGYTLG